MRRAIAICVLACVLAASAAAAFQIDQEVAEPMHRQQEHIDQQAMEIGLMEIDAAQEARDLAEAAADERAAALDAALLEAGASPELHTAVHSMFSMEADDANHHVFVEAQAEQGTSSEAKPSVKADVKAQAPVGTTAELLPVSVSPLPGQKNIPNTFPRAAVAAAAPEADAVTAPRIAAALKNIDTLNRAEQAAEMASSARKRKKALYKKAVAKARQSKKFERDLHDKVAVPHPQSRQAALNGDRITNTLFPAATAKSDGKADSQHSDFQHAGAGDVYTNHINLLQHSEQGDLNADAQFAAEQEQVVEQEQAAVGELDQAAEQVQEAAGELEQVAEGVAGGEEAWSQEAEQAAYAEADAQDAAAASTAADAAQEQSAPLAAQESAAPAELAPATPQEDPTSPEYAPVAAQEPCAEQCEGAGRWKTAPCQDCIVRGMVNGWIVKSVQEQQKGYNYAHYSRNQCVKYANEMALKSPNVKGAPFAHCFFQKMHESCNL